MNDLATEAGCFNVILAAPLRARFAPGDMSGQLV